MTITHAFRAGLRQASGHRKMATLLYATTLMLALLVAIPFYGTLRTQSSHSMAYTALFTNFDYATFQEFVRLHGEAVGALVAQAKWLAVFYIFFNTFLAGGVLHILHYQLHFSLAAFWAGCSRYFLRFLLLNLFLTLAQVAALVLVYAPLVIFFTVNKFVEYEGDLFMIGALGVLVHLFLLSLIVVIGDHAKIWLVRTDGHGVPQAFGRATVLVVRHFAKNYGLYLVWALMPGLMVLAFLGVDALVGLRSGVTIGLMLVAQQALIWGRSWAKVWLLSSQLIMQRGYLPLTLALPASTPPPPVVLDQLP